MPTRTLISNLIPSRRNPGYFLAYYDRRLPNGGNYAVVIPIADVHRYNIRKGFEFDEEQAVFDPDLGASVLRLGREVPIGPPELSPDPQPSVHPEADAGWPDDTDPPAIWGIPTETRIEAAKPQPRLPESRPIHQRPPLNPQLMVLASEVTATFLYQYSQLGRIPEARRADVAQKLTAIALIPYYRNLGVGSAPEAGEHE